MKYRIIQTANDEFVLQKIKVEQGHIIGNFHLAYETIVKGSKEKCEQMMTSIKKGMRNENGEQIIAEYEIERKE